MVYLQPTINDNNFDVETKNFVVIPNWYNIQVDKSMEPFFAAVLLEDEMAELWAS